MKWEEVRKIFPKSYVLLQVLESHVDGDKKYIDDVAIIRAIDDSKEATRELVSAKPGTGHGAGDGDRCGYGAGTSQPQHEITLYGS